MERKSHHRVECPQAPDRTKGLRRVVRSTLAGQLTSEIRAAILDGQFPAGGQLNEMALAGQFGVSRGPVREAIQRLVQEGLLRAEPHRGVFVLDLADDDVVDIYFTRKSLEIAAIRRVMTEPRRTALARELRELTDRMAVLLGTGDWAEIADLDLHYHRRIVEEARSERLSRSYDTLQAETRLCLRLMMAGYRQNRALIEEHERLARFIGDGTPDETEAEMDAHFGDPVRILERGRAAMREAPDLRASAARRNPRDRLDLEGEAREPRHPDGGPVRVGRRADHPVAHPHHRVELRLRVGVEGRDVDHVVEGAARRIQHGVEPREGAGDLRLEIRLGRAVLAAADLAGDEQQVAGADRRRVAVLVVERLRPGGTIASRVERVCAMDCSSGPRFGIRAVCD